MRRPAAFKSDQEACDALGLIGPRWDHGADLLPDEVPCRVHGAIRFRRLGPASAGHPGSSETQCPASVPEPGGHPAERKQLVAGLAEDRLGPYAICIGPADEPID